MAKRLAQMYGKNHYTHIYLHDSARDFEVLWANKIMGHDPKVGHLLSLSLSLSLSPAPPRCFSFSFNVGPVWSAWPPSVTSPRLDWTRDCVC